jgi:PAS domain S-box-containing protein
MCFYAIGDCAEEEAVAELTHAGIDVERAREEGSLTLLRSREFMPLETFDPSAFIALFRARAQQALNAGFYGVGFCIEMIWGKELAVAHDALIQLEARLNTEFFPNAPAIGLCIYERRRLSAEYLRVALRAHPLAIVDNKLISNPYYEPPELIAQPSEAARVDWMFTQLVRWAEEREELRRSHDRLRALIENASDGITVLDAEGRILYEGTSAERLLGYQPEEMVGRHVGDFISPEDVASVIDKIHRALENPDEVQTLRVHGRRRDGSTSTSRQWAGDCGSRPIFHMSSSIGAISASGFSSTTGCASDWNRRMRICRRRSDWLLAAAQSSVRVPECTACWSRSIW